MIIFFTSLRLSFGGGSGEGSGSGEGGGVGTFTSGLVFGFSIAFSLAFVLTFGDLFFIVEEVVVILVGFSGIVRSIATLRLAAC